MAAPESTTPVRFSYFFMVGLFVLMILLKLALPLVAALFTYLALTRLTFFKRGGKPLAIVIFLVLAFGAAYGLGYFVRQTARALPDIADKAIPSIIATAQRYGIQLPFTDYDSLKDAAFDTVKSEAHFLGDFAKFARGATSHVLFLIVGSIVAMSLFVTPRFETGPPHPADTLYSQACEQISRRFATLYRSFVTVMGAQIIISAVNTALTAVFLVAVHLPYAVVVIGVSFLCGLLPVIGNLISNTIVVGIGFTVSPKMALFALIFLIVIHKLEYLLNSKIVGWRIHNPLWLTLLALVVGERLLGVPGMILAPVILYYIKLETSAIKGPSQPI